MSIVATILNDMLHYTYGLPNNIFHNHTQTRKLSLGLRLRMYLCLLLACLGLHNEKIVNRKTTIMLTQPCMKLEQKMM